MRHRRRLDKLRARARAARTEKARAIRARLCVGLGPERIMELVYAAVRADQHPMLEAICGQAEDYQARGHRPANGSPPRLGFVDWVWGLDDGRWSLPEELPEVWLTAWRDGYDPHWGYERLPWCPRPFHRCEDCRLALPNVGPGGSFEVQFEVCPVCGGGRISMVCFFDMRKFSLDGGKTTSI